MHTSLAFKILRAVAPVALGLTFITTGQAAEKSLNWDIRTLTVDSNEGIDVADFNGDGKLDIIAGRNWFAAPDYVARPVRTIEDWNGYVESNGDYAHDVNGDGLIDVIAGSFVGTEVNWFKNPGEKDLKLGKMWPKHLLKDTGYTQNEGQMMHDIDGDGIKEWCVNSWNKKNDLVVWSLGKEEREVEEKKGNKMIKVKRTVPTLVPHIIGKGHNGHGLGFGDLNGDGLEDIIFEGGWYERPKAGPYSGEWTLHADWTFHGSVPMLVRDLNNDGRNDIIVGLAHGFGLHWWEQLPAKDGKLQWSHHTIDNSFSQPHCLLFADIDGDGEDELISGKRYFAHNSRDPGGTEPPCIYYFEWNPKKLKFTRHTIDEGTVGIGLQIRTADLNGDGKLDIAVAGKSGTYLLINKGF
ncbi:VCBS repeat-containing protein [Verrucomicrobia bacterium]|nr:VCBS repeat-containing protein [Verrucomicrobiota bacterium]